jgi:hypothetical protein
LVFAGQQRDFRNLRDHIPFDRQKCRARRRVRRL